MTLDTGEHLSALAADSEAIADVAAEHPDAELGTCPGWKAADLVGHLGGAYSWAALAVQAGGERPTLERDRPPSAPSELDGWFREERARLLEALSAHEPSEPAWVPAPKGRPCVGWWRRRMAAETAVHLYDIETAVGRPSAVAPELAADAVDEMLSELLAMILQRRPVEGLSGTLHLHATDTEGEWYLDLSDPLLPLRREHAKADTAVRGPASGLLLWLWNRLDTEAAGLQVFGDGSLPLAWRNLTI